MKITPVPCDIEPAKSDLVRSPGLHMSQIYGDYYSDLEPTRFVRGSKPDAVRMEAGFCLEEMLEEGLKRRHATRPSEFTVREDGSDIAFSPDLIIFENDQMRLGEIKLTWMSSKEVPREPATSFPTKFDRYFTQMKLYCRALGTARSRLYTYFVNGTYRPQQPELLAWDIDYTKQELDDEWRRQMNHARFKKLLK